MGIMPAARKTHSDNSRAIERTASRTVATAADEHSRPVGSPARRLQDDLRASFSAEPEIEGKWSARRTIAFALLASAMLWGAIGAGAYALLQGLH